MKVTPMQVDLLDHMGSDLTVVDTARVSFAKKSELINVSMDDEKPVYELSDADKKLIHFLARNNHWTPFGHCFAQFRIKAPIFVARQLVKHQVGLVWNEESRRYIDSEPEFYIPEVWRGRPDGSIKQGSKGQIAANKIAILFCEQTTKDSLGSYLNLLDIGVAPEQARMVLPLNTHTEWIWSGSLAAWARVCKLRLDSHAQQETKEIAQDISDHMAHLFPVSWGVLVDG